MVDQLPAGNELPSPFDAGNVEVTPDPENPQVLALSFDSTLLGRRTSSLVWVPDVYLETTQPVPVVYFLHGTIATTIHPAWERWAGRLLDRGVALPFGLQPQRGTYVDKATMRFDETLDRQRFLIVAPDAGPPHWCVSCNWVDGLDGTGVLAESHLYQELFPLVEAMFRVRSDRGGRGIIGHSMGGGGAIIQGFRHPDRFAFVGSSSGTLSLLDDFLSRSGVRWFLYNRSQGFRPIRAHEIFYRNNNTLDLAPQVVGSGLEIVAVVGDGTPTGEIRPGNRLSPREDSRGEAAQRKNNDQIAHRLMELGVPLTYVRRRGWHSIGASTFRRYFLDRLHRVFDEPVPDPEWFTYKAVDRRFSIWGYDLAVDRPNNEFLNILRARTNGRDFTLAGTGTVKVATPPAFEPGVSYRVTTTSGSESSRERRVNANEAGRLELTLILGEPRAIDERRSLVDRGKFPFPQTRVEISNR